MELNNFTAVAQDDDRLAALRAEVRQFLADARSAGVFTRATGWDHWDPDFSREVGARGWIGMTWPRRYGGQERSSLERYVVTEELLAAGAPVRAHWMADRQLGPLLLSAGSEAQKLAYLPRIASGELFFCYGLSEPDSGSDLASIRTAGRKVEGGWSITGRKVWVGYAHRAHMMNLFARTSPRSDEDRHGGVTQFIVDMKTPGITVRPIISLAGEHDFNEIVFDDAFVPDDMVIGTVGNGWKQVTGDLAHERSSPERWLSSFGLLTQLVDRVAARPAEADLEKLGRLVAQLWTLRQMSFSIATMLGRGEAPNLEAALIKDLGNAFDQDVPAVAREIVSEQARAALPPEDAFNTVMDRALYYSPSYTIRGGTKEILRGVIAKGLGLK
ncbi:acyl-CoA dehydrogenase family protein [Pigmentiphaga soli]|uniref:Acyl-CoA dehydrogenase family protein n=1 Tax=Pigmentiphaga soli TaxID=1007095 RepID=A0ABP8HS26_9BURK